MAAEFSRLDARTTAGTASAWATDAAGYNAQRTAVNAVRGAGGNSDGAASTFCPEHPNADWGGVLSKAAKAQRKHFPSGQFSSSPDLLSHRDPTAAAGAASGRGGSDLHRGNVRRHYQHDIRYMAKDAEASANPLHSAAYQTGPGDKHDTSAWQTQTQAQQRFARVDVPETRRGYPNMRPVAGTAAADRAVVGLGGGALRRACAPGYAQSLQAHYGAQRARADRQRFGVQPGQYVQPHPRGPPVPDANPRDPLRAGGGMMRGGGMRRSQAPAARSMLSDMGALLSAELNRAGAMPPTAAERKKKLAAGGGGSASTGNLLQKGQSVEDLRPRMHAGYTGHRRR